MKINSIQIKIISIISLILLITITVIIYITVNNQKKDLLDSAKNTLSINTEILSNTIRGIMLSGEAPIAVNTMKRIKTSPELKEVDIYRTSGDVAFFDYATVDFVNKYQDLIKFKKTGRVNNKMSENDYFKLTLQENKPYDHEIKETKEMEYFFPIENERDCWACHGTAEETGSIRGIAHFKISIANIYNRINRARFFLILLFIISGLLLAAVLIIIMRRLIVKPLLTIGSTVNKFGEGDLDITVNLKNKDELGDLAIKLNEMFKRVKERFELSKFVSKSTDAMIKSGNKKEAENKRRDITVVFTDIRGFTSYSESRTPDEVVKSLNRVLQIQADIVEAYGGDIDKFVGDEVMAIFDDPLQAVKAAYEMIINVKKMNSVYNTSLYIGVGINTGDVVAGNIGSTSRAEYAVIGDTVNLASRLCNLAKPNMMLISEATHTALKDKINAKLIANQKIKGKKGSVNFYVVKSLV